MHTAPVTSLTRRFVAASAAAVTLLTGGVSVARDAAAAPAPSRGAASQIVSLCDTEVEVGHARCFAEAEVPVGAGAVANGATPRGLTPADLLSAYRLPAHGGAGTTIGIVDAYDNPTAAADLAVYRSTFGLPALRTGQLRTIDQRGGDDLPAPDAGWAGEIALDLDAVSAVAPLADIVLVEADSSLATDLAAAVTQAVAAGADVVSNSYGSRYSSAPGAGEDPSQAQDEQYDHPGVAIVASTGDDGYGVAFPAASPHVTAVGGTTLKVAPDTSRGWTETVWSGAGSGCSAVQPKPTWQNGTGCDQRAVADVSAVADPRTGFASYNTYSARGWSTIGGTSLAAPVVAGVYALAGKPVAGTEPVTYPWSKPGALFDVTRGTNGSCDPVVWCTAARGWDGPTGLGSPNGTTAFTTGPHGTIAGVVTTTAAGHAPVAGATVTATRTDGTADASDRVTAVTGDDGRYTLTVSAGRWQVGAVAYSSYDAASGVVTVRADRTTTADLAMRPRSVRTVSGRVTDASGHGWALPATVSVDGLPGAPAQTAPLTGRYTLGLPAGRSYTLHVTSAFPGYLPVTRTVRVAAADVTTDVGLTVDPLGVAAPGYETRFTGPTQTFDSPAAAPAGWSVTDTGDTPGWSFDDPGARGNLTGGGGGFAIADSDHAGAGHHQDSLLTGPVTDLRRADHPVVEFDTILQPFDGQTATVDLSTDGGTTWATVWTPSTTSATISGHVQVPVPAAAHQQAVRVRFHYAGVWAQYWEIDDVSLGDRTQATRPGGLVLGEAVDANTGSGLEGVTVTGPADTGAVTGGGARVGNARFEVFAPTGAATWTAIRPGYLSSPTGVTVTADQVTAATFPLAAGRTATATTDPVTTTVAAGATATASFTVTNTGTAPVTITPREQAAGYDVPAGNAAPVDVSASVSRSAAVATTAAGRVAAAVPPNSRGGVAHARRNSRRHPGQRRGHRRRCGVVGRRVRRHSGHRRRLPPRPAHRDVDAEGRCGDRPTAGVGGVPRRQDLRHRRLGGRRRDH